MSPSNPYDRGRLEAWDASCLWRRVPFQDGDPDADPLLIVAGEGCYLIDIDGRRYLDGVGSWCGNVLGHRRPEVDSAVRDQLDRIAHTTLTGHANAPAVELAHRLVELSPEPLTRVFYGESGRTAVEAALGMALRTWQSKGESQPARSTVVGLVPAGSATADSGDGVRSLALGGIHELQAPGALRWDLVWVAAPAVYRVPGEGTVAGQQRQATEALEATIRALGDQLAAVLVKPGYLGDEDVLTYPDGFLDRLEAVTREVGALLIFDETAVGLGRSGRLFACQREQIQPDLLCLANGLTGGYLPLAATLTTEAIYSASRKGPEPGRIFPQEDAYRGNPLACAAAIATLDVLHRERLLERLPLKIDYLRRSLDRLRVRTAVGQIRQYGFAVGIELVADRKSRRPFAVADRIGSQVCRAIRERRVLAHARGDVIVLMPPLTMTAHQIDQLVDAVDYGIRSATA